jgi:glycine/D-amino acid oxidase-like deaminating enzyme
MPNDVAILGGGFMGVCAALECAHRGISVDLYDRRSELLTEAGRVNEGKIHVGYVYANDPTEKTAPAR